MSVVIEPAQSPTSC